MDRKEPSYELRLLQRLIGQGPVSSVITRAAVDGATEIDIELDDLVSAVLTLAPEDFYKSMESERFPGLWQDVYHLAYRGRWIYVKLQILPSGIGVVVQFKRK